VDDIGAILVIAIFYTGSIHFTWLAASLGALVLVATLQKLRVWWTPVYVIVGIFVWLAMLESGVHATIAGVALGLLTPARAVDPRGIGDIYRAFSEIEAEPDAETVRAASMQANEVVSVAERLEHLLHPWTSYLVIPIFALANAGIALSGDGIGRAFGSSVTWGIILGLIAGKMIGITGASWLAIRSGWASAPQGVTMRHLLGGSAVAGIGFTVSLFISGLAFEEAELIDAAKIGIFVASIAAGTIGAVLLASGRPVSEVSGE
ncbi:MAG: Na+/H+ antiporter NhaA, partial [Actinomycetota bacterium]